MDNILNSRLRFGEEIKDGDLRLTEFDNRKLALTNIIDSYLKKNIDANMLDCLILRNSLKFCQMWTIEYIGS